MTHYAPTASKKSEISVGQGCLLLTLIFTVLAPLSMLYRAWALTVLWGWFVVPVTGWPSLGIWGAIGLAALIFLFHSSTGDKADEWARKELGEGVGATVWRAVFTSIWTPSIALIVGYIAHAFQ